MVIPSRQLPVSMNIRSDGSANSDANISSGTNNETYKEDPCMVAMTALEAYPSALCLNSYHSCPSYENRSKRMPVAKFITMPVITTAQRIVG